ncbi:shikimate kinase [Nakamurella sp.]|uniref:shikimate kinase n=1 Tax=Nakamurella sp. TaxID=1869182 RepID=UPI003783691A
MAAPAEPGAARPLVVLVGPPGSGKTSVGGALARLTGKQLRDTDHDIEITAGRPIPDIFLTDGEPAFRALERAAVATALVEHDGVLALGGGSVLAEPTRALLKRHTVVFLSVTMPTGVRRTGLASNRPLLTGVNPRATYKALLDARLHLYQEVATLEVATDELTVEQVATVIVEELRLS